jgi:integral membrane protein (TIGR00529 family)
VIDLVKLLGVLLLILVLLRLRWNLGLVLLLASASTGLLFGLALNDLARDALVAAIDPLTLRLVAIVLLITFLGEILRSTLQLEGLIRSLVGLVVDRRWLLAMFPMLIGLLPMVGGAMFSAPMVEEASQGLDTSREQRTFVNYWFRHSLEPIFPLYPSLVLAAGLMGVTVQTLTVTQWPLFLVAVVGGVLFGLMGIPHTGASEEQTSNQKETWGLLLRSIWPILLVVILSIGLQVDLIVALLLTIGLLILFHRLGPRQLVALTQKMPLGTVPIIVGAMVFRHILETSSAVGAALGPLATLGIPLPLIVFAVPMIAGLLTGLAVGAFAIGFPIVLPLAGPDFMASGYGFVAFAGGFAGMMLSPIHLCLALTRAYFRAQWGGIYQRLVPATLLAALTTLIVFLTR